MKRILLVLSLLAFMPQSAFAAPDVFALTGEAEKGDAEAQYSLALLYQQKQDDGQNAASAVKWFQKAAVQGHLKAQLALGDMRADSGHDLQDYAEAATWYRKAADQGSAEAQYKLGNLYANGQGVKQAYEEAYFWYLIAANTGSEDAGKNRDQVAGMLTPQQLAEAQGRAKEWKPSSAPPAKPAAPSAAPN